MKCWYQNRFPLTNITTRENVTFFSCHDSKVFWFVRSKFPYLLTPRTPQTRPLPSTTALDCCLHFLFVLCQIPRWRPEKVLAVFAVNPATSFGRTPWRSLGPILSLAPKNPYKAASIAVFAATIPDRSQVGLRCCSYSAVLWCGAVRCCVVWCGMV